mmetsp:Transcript_103442/g.331657  ORF Transcript_103442/g.331657 Transcript_103442/m.331657 type:complete len:385 (+) Transcript_103442:748-1902(+)
MAGRDPLLVLVRPRLVLRRVVLRMGVMEHLGDVRGLHARLQLPNLLLPLVFSLDRLLQLEVQALHEILEHTVLTMHFPITRILLHSLCRLVRWRATIGHLLPLAASRPRRRTKTRAMVRNCRFLVWSQQQHVVGSLDLSEQSAKHPVSLDDLFEQVAVDLQPRHRHLPHVLTRHAAAPRIRRGREPGLRLMGLRLLGLRMLGLRHQGHRGALRQRPPVRPEAPRAAARHPGWARGRAGVERRIRGVLPLIHGLLARPRHEAVVGPGASRPVLRRGGWSSAAGSAAGAAGLVGGQHAVLAKLLCQPALELQGLPPVLQLRGRCIPVAAVGWATAALGRQGHGRGSGVEPSGIPLGRAVVLLLLLLLLLRRRRLRASDVVRSPAGN